MAEDLIKTFRSKVGPKASPASLVVNRQREPYEAFGTKDKLRCFDLRCHDGTAHVLPYPYVLAVSYDRRHFREIFITASGLAITIKGRGLRPIVDALKLHTCEYIQAYDREVFNEPTVDGGPYVDTIDVEVIRGKPAADSAPR